jgi:phosphotriesterase-related protein
MLAEMRKLQGKVITARGPVAPSALGRVMMHEHLHSDLYDWRENHVVWEEKPNEERRQYLLQDAVPHIKKCKEFGCHAFCDVTMPPWRAWPNVYREVSEAADFHIILATGFYREIELSTYFVKTPYDQIWPYVRTASVQELTDLCVREIVEGIHGTDLRAGCIKLGTSQPAMTEAEIKTFRAGARAWAQTGVHVTTHCTRIGSETSQLQVLDDEGTDLTRVVIGHTAGHLMNPDCRKVCLEWMKRGVHFMPTNLGIGNDGGKRWQPLVDAIHEVFNAGHGDKLVLGLDSGYCSESREFGPMTFLPPAPFAHMFTHTLPAFRSMGLTEEEEEAMMKTNPQRILPVR